jgi:signal transduction histidine kinase
VLPLVLATGVGLGSAAVLTARREAGLGALVFAGCLAVGAAGSCGTGVPAGAGVVAALLLPVIAIHLALAVPTGRVTRPASIALAAAYVVVLATTAVLPAPVLPGLCDSRPAAWALVAADLAAAVTTAVVAGPVRRGTRRSARVRVQWFAAGLVALTPTLALLLPWSALAGSWSDAPTLLGVTNLALPLALVAATGPVARRNAGPALRVATITAALATTALGVFLALLVGLGRPPNPAERPVLRLALLAAFAIVLVAPLVHRRVSRAVDHAVQGDRESHEEMLRRLGGQLSRALPWNESLLRLAESLRDALRLSAVEVYTRADGALVREVALPRRGPPRLALGAEQEAVVCHSGVRGDGWIPVWLPELAAGRESSTMRIVPLCAADELLGLIAAERTDTTDPFGEDEDEVLAELGAQVSLALRSVRLDLALRASLAEVRRQAEDLRASRARVVEAADAERRRIERDLHDGAQQSLIALSLSARAARDIVDAQSPQAAGYLDALVGDLRRTADELRELAHGIYPPLLTDSGVGVALRVVVPRCCPGAAVDTTDRRYPPVVEGAVYFCCLEAMQNAAKYASGGRVGVRVWEDDGRLLRFEVVDDGPGFDRATTPAGHGLVNMADRLGAIGGRITVESAPGRGTVVAGTVPLDDVSRPAPSGTGVPP